MTPTGADGKKITMCKRTQFKWNWRDFYLISRDKTKQPQQQQKVKLERKNLECEY